MKLRLLTKLILCILVPAVLGLTVLSFMSGRNAEQGISNQIDEELRLVSAVQARELDNILKMLQSVVVNLSQDEHISSYFIARADGLSNPRLLWSRCS